MIVLFKRFLDESNAVLFMSQIDFLSILIIFKIIYIYCILNECAFSFSPEDTRDFCTVISIFFTLPPFAWKCIFIPYLKPKQSPQIMLNLMCVQFAHRVCPVQGSQEPHRMARLRSSRGFLRGDVRLFCSLQPELVQVILPNLLIHFFFFIFHFSRKL